MKLSATIMALTLLVPSAALAQPAKRAALPPLEAVEQAKKLIADVYKKDYQAAKSAAQKQLLAKKLLDDANKATDDPASQYALHQVARKMAISIGDADLALKAIDASAASFAIDSEASKLEAFAEIGASLKTPAEQQALTRFIGRELPQLQERERYASALALIELGIEVAKKASDPDLVKQWTRRQEDVQSRATAYEALPPALQALEKSPGDPAANSAVGRYYCFVKEDWPKGLPMLALGGDPSLQKLAERELDAAATPVERLALADAWYAFAKQESAPVQQAALRFAGKRYEQLVAGLSALPKRRVEQRLKELREITSPFPKNEWVEILDLVELPRHQLIKTFHREGLAVTHNDPRDCHVFRIPVAVDGAYELRIRGLQVSGEGGMMVTLSQSARCVEMWFDRGGVTALSKIGGKDGMGNATRTKSNFIVVGKPVTLGVRVEPREEQVQISATSDGRKVLGWTGPSSALGIHHPEWNDSFHVGCCDGVFAVASVQLKVLSGAAWMVD